MILVACPSCDRQYDVTDVPRGRRIRCACDEVLVVEPSEKSLEVHAFHCGHCGGQVTADDGFCPWCSAKLSATDRRRGTVCPKCFARLDDDAKHCSSCGVAIQPQALTPLPAERGCPRCGCELRLRSLDVTDVVECSVCMGLWLTTRTFESICREAHRDQAFRIANEAPRGGLRVEDKVTYIPCLTCDQMMHRRQFRHGKRSSGVVVDYCKGHGVWLDHTELERIVEFLQTDAGDAGLAPYLDVPVRRSKGSSGGRASGPIHERSTGETLLEGVVAALVIVAEILWS